MSFFGEIDHMVSCDGDHPLLGRNTCTDLRSSVSGSDLLTSSIGEGSSENRVGFLLFSGKIGDTCTFRDWASEVWEQ